MVESLKKRFERYISQKALFKEQDKILLTVSGGVDSMVMLSLFHSLNYEIGVAHCNFGLRDSESDGDELLVKYLCEKLSVPFFVKKFDVHSEVEQTGESTQMVARRLRYDWFEQLRIEQNYNSIAIAHHADDSIETFFINLFRGTGLRGLTGISRLRGHIVRPMLFCSRKEILEYAHDHKIKFREDSSNSSTKYLRNKIRLGLIPRIREINPKFTSLMCGNIEKLSDTQLFIHASMQKLREEVITKYQDQEIINPELINQSYPLNFVLYELLSTYGFKGDVVENISRALSSGEGTGKKFYSKQNLAFIDRGRIIIEAIKDTDPCQSIIEEYIPRFYAGASTIFVEKLDIDQIETLQLPNNIALLDYDKLHFPLTLRRWEEGDSISPLGLSGRHKKVSDILIDAKMSLMAKNRQFVLCNGDEIAWLIGHRIDEKYKVDKTTETVIKLTQEI